MSTTFTTGGTHLSAPESPDLKTSQGALLQSVEVAIVGGGVGGLAASIALARSLRSVAVIDSSQPRNAPSAHVHNVLGHEGISPLELLAKGRAEADDYGVVLIDGTVTEAVTKPVTASRDTIASENRPGLAERPHRFELTTSSGDRVLAQRVILATGLCDELPEIPGLAEGWGESVLHCPYCHGYEVRGQRIGVIGTTAMSYHQAMLFSQLSDRVTVFRHNAPEPDVEQSAMLASLDIAFVDAKVVEVARSGAGTVLSLDTDETSEFVFDALAVGGYARANSELFTQLGGSVTDHPSGMGSSIPTTVSGQTDLPGVWAIGNSADITAMVVASTASGVLAASHVNADLIMESIE